MHPDFLFNQQLVFFVVIVEFIDKVYEDKCKYASFNMRSTNFPDNLNEYLLPLLKLWFDEWCILWPE